jgi:tRNA (cmo5U34)-methyltransferase
MKNIFLDYPEFIDRDPRKNRGTLELGRYQPSAKFQYIRHNTTLPPSMLAGLKVLDLGCCVAASGAWALHHGADSYIGIEMEKKFCDIAEENLKTYFPEHRWKIKNQSIEEFFSENQNKFDIVIAWGIIFGSLETQKFLKELCKITKDRVLIDDMQPTHIINLKKLDKNSPQLLKKYGIDINLLATQEIQDTATIYRPIKGAHLAETFVKIMMNHYGFDLEKDFSTDLTNLLPNEYVNRYSFSFVKKESLPKTISAAEHYNNNPSYTPTHDVWKFDSIVASDFVNHARHHIPGYDKVIKKTVDICKLLLTPFDQKHRIIDVGCADGETIKHLYFSGFRNLVGVDSSKDMLTSAKNKKINEIAELIEQNTFPKKLGPYKSVICNWTLHFIKDKVSYLTDIYNSLLPGGILILTDKTYNNGASIKLYHDFKKTQGLSEKEINDKHNSLKDVMFIDSPVWYLDTLKNIGFSDISIVGAEYCFTSFLAIKK